MPCAQKSGGHEEVLERFGGAGMKRLTYRCYRGATHWLHFAALKIGGPIMAIPRRSDDWREKGDAYGEDIVARVAIDRGVVDVCIRHRDRPSCGFSFALLKEDRGGQGDAKGDPQGSRAAGTPD